MKEVIVYQVQGTPVSVTRPGPEASVLNVPLLQVAQHAVPDGVPFWLIEESDVPTDRAFREAWELDVSAMGEPAGFGDSAAFAAWWESAQ